LSKILVFMVLAVSMLATGATAATASYAIGISSNQTVGEFLVNETGYTLYYFQSDAPGNGISTCSGDCATTWPPFYAEEITVPAGLEASDFTAIDRADGQKQIAYKGWPLYFYSLDTKAGDILGQGVRGVWFVVNPSDFPPVET
jgi:predicted lipoprotein with Yx(FWY)xxD motif